MRRIFLILIVATLLLTRVQAQQVNYTITKNEPSFNNVPNLYVTPIPLLSMDFPIWGPNPDAILSSSLFGFGIRTHAIIGEKFQADLNFHQGIWPAKTRFLEIGGAMILRSRTKQKTTEIILDRKDVSLSQEQINFINVPYTQLNFSGLRGGLMYYKSIFDFNESGFDRTLNAYPSAVGHTNSVGVYGGITWGKLADLKIQLKDGRKRNHSVYHQFYAEVLLAAHFHTYTINTVNKSVSPIGFRIGGDVYKPTKGILGTVYNIEVGYRPGYDGIYAKLAVFFIQVRQNLPILRSL